MDNHNITVPSLANAHSNNIDNMNAKSNMNLNANVVNEDKEKGLISSASIGQKNDKDWFICTTCQMEFGDKKSFLIHENKFCTSFYESNQNENENMRQVANHNHDYRSSKDHEGQLELQRAKVEIGGLDLHYKQVSDYLQISNKNKPYKDYERQKQGLSVILYEL